jgi:hypothetical protein
MDRELGSGLKQVRREFEQLYGQRFEIRDIGLPVCAIPVDLGIDACLDWIRLHSRDIQGESAAVFNPKSLHPVSVYSLERSQKVTN